MYLLRMYFTITPGKYDEAMGLMRRIKAASQRHGLPAGRVLASHFVSFGNPNWTWEAEFESLAAMEAGLEKMESAPEMEEIGPASVGVWNQQWIEVYHIVDV